MELMGKEMEEWYWSFVIIGFLGLATHTKKKQQQLDFSAQVKLKIQDCV